MQQQNVKSATTAGLLGIFLGSFGAHNWYLGEKSKGIIHICMMSGGVLVEIIAGAVLPNVMSFSMLLQMAWLFTILTGIAGLAMSASAIWGLVEGIIILSQGDAGLARKGYPVAQPMMNPNPGYQQPNGPQGYGPQGYNQNYYNPQNYNQPMSNQFPDQSMNNNFNQQGQMNMNPNMPNNQNFPNGDNNGQQ